MEQCCVLGAAAATRCPPIPSFPPLLRLMPLPPPPPLQLKSFFQLVPFPGVEMSAFSGSNWGRGTGSEGRAADTHPIVLGLTTLGEKRIKVSGEASLAKCSTKSHLWSARSRVRSSSRETSHFCIPVKVELFLCAYSCLLCI